MWDLVPREPWQPSVRIQRLSCLTLDFYLTRWWSQPSSSASQLQVLARLLHRSGSSKALAHSSASGPHLAPPPAHAWGSAAKGAGQGRGWAGVGSGARAGAGAGAGQRRAHSAAVLSVFRALGHPVTLLLPSAFPILLTLGRSHGCCPPFVSWGNTGIPCHLLLF